MIPDIGNVTVNNAEIPLVGIGNINVGSQNSITINIFFIIIKSRGKSKI